MANYPAYAPDMDDFNGKTLSITEESSNDLLGLGRSSSSPNRLTDELLEAGLVSDGDGIIAGPAGVWAVGD